jgi:hypothetical protein
MTGFDSKRRIALDRLAWRCSHGWLRGEQCEICNAPQRPWVELTNEEIEAIEEKALTKQWAIRMALTAVKEKNT